MPISVSDTCLDGILAIQLSVAWAGEGRCEPSRLGWWQTDLIDEDGGGDLLARLLPKTHAWAKLEAVREAGRRVDEQERRRSGAPDELLTLFHLGFDLDERLRERLEHHRRHHASPSDVFGPGFAVTREFSAGSFEDYLGQLAAAPDVEITPEGRRLLGALPTDPMERVARLAAALRPIEHRYVLPHYRL